MTNLNARKWPAILTVSSLGLLLAACGGGSSSDITSLTADTATVSGTVPGTFIEAFCADGRYFSTHSEQNGIAQHPFELELPVGLACRLVMTTNERAQNRIITAIQLQANGETGGNFALSSALNLGYVPLAKDDDGDGIDDISGQNIIDSNGDGVVDDPLAHDLGSNTALMVRQLSNDPLDSDGDDIPDYYEDDDHDGVNNYEDDDDDNDGTPDSSDEDNHDHDGDGIDDDYDRDSDNDGSDDNNSGSTVYTPVENYTVTRGRLLASQCAQCHGTNGHSTTSWDSIAGESAGEIIEEMNEYPTSHIMGAQGIGYTQSEIEDLAAYLSTLSSSESDGYEESYEESDD